MSDSSVTPQTVAGLTPLSLGLPRQEYWSRLPFPPPGGLPTQGWNPRVGVCWQAGSLPLSHHGSPFNTVTPPPHLPPPFFSLLLENSFIEINTQSTYNSPVYHRQFSTFRGNHRTGLEHLHCLGTKPRALISDQNFWGILKAVLETFVSKERLRVDEEPSRPVWLPRPRPRGGTEVSRVGHPSPRLLPSPRPLLLSPFPPTSVSPSDAVLSLPFPQQLSSSWAPHRVPAAPSSDTAYPLSARRQPQREPDNVPGSETSSEMGIQVNLLLLKAPVKRTVRRGEVLNFTSHSTF